MAYIAGYPSEEDKTVKIHFTNKKDEVEGFYTIMTSGMPGTVSSTNEYFVTPRQIKMLKDKRIEFVIDH